MTTGIPKSDSLALLVLTLLFALRVAGQVLVALFGPPFLPPMEDWYSGLIPYPILLPIQILILLLMLKINADMARGTGFFAVPRIFLGTPLRWFSFLYFTSMIVRYILTMAWVPRNRWFVGTIPIFFHLVLAGYLFTVSRYHLFKER